MIIDVEDPLRNFILNSAFVAVVLIAIAALIPWGLLGARKLGRLATWLPIPALAIAVIYEAAMPSRYDIRLDLLLLLPAYGLVLLATLIRLVAHWRARRKNEIKRTV